jgi:hypothetical protein
MKKPALILARIIWIFWALSWTWGLATGNLVRPFHPLNFISSVSIITGVICIWPKKVVSHFIAAAAGIIASLIMGFQFSVLVYAFPTGSQIRTNWGPIEFEGTIALLMLFAPLFTLLTTSAIILWKSADEIDKKKEPNQSLQTTTMAVTDAAAQPPRQP